MSSATHIIFEAVDLTMDICDHSPGNSQLCAPDLLARTVDICATLAEIEPSLTISAGWKSLLLEMKRTHRAALEFPTPSRARRLVMECQ
jgi:hypothetical protein